MKIQRAAVIGAGTMGSGIAQVLSQAGIEVILKDVNADFVDKGLAKIKRMYESRVKKEVLTQAEADYLMGMIKGTTSYDDFKNVDIVIEAALEEMNVKAEIFSQIDKICPPHAVLASNTSALSISEIASHTKRPEKVIGMHFFNPAQTMKLVEVIPGIHTADEITRGAIELCRKLNKIPVRVEECPGFLVNRLLFPYLNEALYVLQDGIATAHEIDKAAVDFGMPMGPLALLDMTGIDVCAHVNDFLYSQYGPRFQPALLLSELANKKQFGQKSGMGIFVHPQGQPAGKDQAKQINPDLQKLIENANKKQKASSQKGFDVHRIMLPMLNEAIYALQEKVVEAGDVDVAMQWGCGMSKGLLSIAEAKGLAWCLSELESYQANLGERFRPSWLMRKLVCAKVHDFSSAKMIPVAVG